MATTTHPTLEKTISPPGGQLPRRDYFLIPMTSLATILLLFGLAESTARMLYPMKEYDECRVQGETDPRRAMPNCVVTAKMPEGPWVSYAMNACGFRTPDGCNPKPPGTIRLALLGASMTMAKNVPLEDSWGERLRHSIAGATGRKVEVENLGWELLSPLHCYRQTDQVITLRPDVVIYAVNPFDIARGIDPKQLAARNAPPSSFPRFEGDTANESRFSFHQILKAIQNSVADSRAIYMAQHFLFANPDAFAKIYLNDGNRADYVRQPFTQAWQKRFTDFHLLVQGMAEKYRQQGIPMILVSLPARIQVILLEKGSWSANLDPLAYDRELEKAANDAGIKFVSTTQAFAKAPNGEKLFFVIDTHITPDGDALIAKTLLPVLLSDPAVSNRNK